MRTIERRASFGGWQHVIEHDATTVGSTMRVGVYLPPAAAEGPCPVLYWLSGLTCTEQNFITKAGAQRAAAEHGIIIVAPDTSPRGQDIANDSADDLGQGAGFYLNATEAPWAANFQMFDYITQELPALIAVHFPTNGRQSIFGHSMGGHGALVAALRCPGQYASVSAFAPIAAPMEVPWGEKAFTAYLGADRARWAAWDASQLAQTSTSDLPILIDQGDADGFWKNQLKPELFAAACDKAGRPLTIRIQPGYDHSYYFIGSFIDEHIAWHMAALSAA